MPIAFRLGAGLIGLVAVALSAYGAYEYQRGLEDRISYLVLAAPFVAAAAALIPVFAELTWRGKQPVKAIIWFFILIPAALTVFLAVAERTHYAQASGEAERRAAVARAVRGEASLQVARSRLESALEDQRKALSLRQCRADCQAKHERAVRGAQEAVLAAEGALSKAQARVLTEAPIALPSWLLPASLDLIAFMSIWTALAPKAPRRKPKRTPKRTQARKKSGNIYQLR
jgi:hypothetical protein